MNSPRLLDKFCEFWKGRQWQQHKAWCVISLKISVLALKRYILLMWQPKDFIKIVYGVCELHIILLLCLAEHWYSNSSLLPYACFSVSDWRPCHMPATLLLTTSDTVDRPLYQTNKIISYSDKNVEENKSEKQTLAAWHFHFLSCSRQWICAPSLSCLSN